MEFNITSKRSKKNIILRLVLGTIAFTLLTTISNSFFYNDFWEDSFHYLWSPILAFTLWGLLFNSFMIVDFNRKGLLGGKFTIADDGVYFMLPKHSAFIPWSDVENISIETYKYFNFKARDYICFFSKYHSSQNRTSKIRIPSSFGKISSKYIVDENFMYMEYDEKALTEIKKYFNKDIITERYNNSKEIN